MLAGAARGEKEVRGGGKPSEVTDIDTGRLSGLKYKLLCHFKLAWVGMASGSL